MSGIAIFDYIISFVDKIPSVGIYSTRCEPENLYGRSLGSKKRSQFCQYRLNSPVAYMQATQRWRILLMSLAICRWGILHSSCKAAPKAWSVYRLWNSLHAGRECLKHAWLTTSRDQAGSFVKIKFMRNGVISLSFTDIGKSCLSPELLPSQICLLTLFPKIKFSRKFPN